MLNQLDLVDVYRTPHQQYQNTHYFPVRMETLTRIHHILPNKTKLNQFKRFEVIPSVFSDHIVIELEINNNKTSGRWKYLECLQNTSK